MPGRKLFKNNYRPNPIPRYDSFKEQIKHIEETLMSTEFLDQFHANILHDVHKDITKFCNKFVEDIDPEFVLNLVYCYFKVRDVDTEVGFYHNELINCEIPLVWVGKHCLDTNGNFDTFTSRKALVNNLDLISECPKSYNEMLKAFEETYLKPRIGLNYPPK